MVRHTLKIMQQMLQDFQSVSDHFGELCIKGLKSVLERLLFCLFKEGGLVERDIMYLMIGTVFVCNHIISTLQLHE